MKLYKSLVLSAIPRFKHPTIVIGLSLLITNARGVSLLRLVDSAELLLSLVHGLMAYLASFLPRALIREDDSLAVALACWIIELRLEQVNHFDWFQESVVLLD